MKKSILIIIILINCITIKAQSTYTIKSENNTVSAKHYLSFDEGIDSVIIKNKNCKLKLSNNKPLFEFEGIVNTININHIKKITNQSYLLIGVANLNWETQLNLIIIKKNKILKYYIIKSNSKRLRDVSFEYLPKTKEVIIPISKRYTPQDYIYDIDLKQNKLDSIKPLTKKISDTLFYHYKLKIE
ncbi:hypothetical protein [uncultured Algibacter sp.]|uniref:hypothetical protein n=1 Tax=uncultured Algibacter sp. TaxID=298659 RepID=UPI003217BD6F